MKHLVFHPEALTELQAQAIYYDERCVGLGAKFTEQVEAALALAMRMPAIGSPHRHGTRRVFPKDFPHSLVYRETPNSIHLIAVAPFRRKPAYWQHRQ